MAISVAVGVSDQLDPVEAFELAAAEAAAGLGGRCDLAIVFAAAPHLTHAKPILWTVHERLDPRSLIGCGAGGVLGSGRELEDGPGAVVWALSAPEAKIETHHLQAEPADDGIAVSGLPEPSELGDGVLVLADPYTFSAEALLESLNADRPGMPVLGGLASAAAAGSAALFRDGEVVDGGAVAVSLEGVGMIPCVSQGAAPVGPEMTITAARGNVIEELASKPAIERLREAIGQLDPDQQALAAQGLMLGIVIDENQPAYERGDFLVRPILGAEPESGTIALGERVRVGQTVRMHVRDGASADEDLREALRLQAQALGAAGAAGALLFTCNGRGSHMFDTPDHDALALEDALGAPAGGFFCAGEIGPVGGRNFLHGFTATMAVFPRVSEGLAELVARALAEDVGAGDITSEATVPAGARARARIVQKQPGVVFGLDAAAEVFAQVGAESFERLLGEGEWRDGVPADVAAVTGPARALLAGERTALNLLAHLSGIATLTARFVEAVGGTEAEILDTRKTTPGLRALEKAAVAAGGGRNHRLGLDDAILIKENHIAIAGGLGRAVELASAAHPQLVVEVECRNAAEVAEALAAGAGRILLDNMSTGELRDAVAARDAAGSTAKLEASGGVTLANVAEVAATGVEMISVGALTHSAPALDLSMLLEIA